MYAAPMRLRSAGFAGGEFGEEVGVEQPAEAAVVRLAAVLHAEEVFPRAAGVFGAAARCRR